VKQPVAPSIPQSNSTSTSTARVPARAAVVFSLALASLSVLAGCPGSLEGDFPPPGNSTGSGGSSSGSGGSTSGSGGSNMTGSGGSGSGGSGSGSGGSMATCDAPTMIFKDKCAMSGCHVSGGPFPPDLSGSNPETRLIGKASLEGCGNYLEASKPASGALIKKISGTTCGGSQMPAGDPLTAEQIQCVTDWANSKL